jgi:hypothetical protein
MSTRTRQTIPVSEVTEGMTLPGVGNAYVFEVEESPDFRDRYNVGLARHLTCLTVHDQNGEECYLLLTADSMIEVAE